MPARLRAPAALLLLALLQAAPTAASTPLATPAVAPEAPADDAAAAPDVPVVTYKDGRLSVQAANVPLPIVLRAVANATGAAVRGDVPQRTVTVNFSGLQPAVAMPRILGEQSFMLRYGAGGSLRTIELFGRSDGGPLGPPVGVAAPMVPAPVATAGAALAAAERDAAKLQQPITLNGELAEAIGAREASIGRILHAAAGEEDPHVRQQARTSVIQAFKQHPDAEAAYFSTLSPVADDTLAATFEGQGPGTQELLAELVVHVQSPALRVKLQNVMAAMQARQNAAQLQP